MNEDCGKFEPSPPVFGHPNGPTMSKLQEPPNECASLLLREDLYAAWKYATRAVNCCESASLPDTREAMVEIVVKLSQQLEFVDSELQAQRIQVRRDERDRRENYDQESVT